MLGIAGKLGVWLYHILTDRTQSVRLQGGVNFDSPVISGVPQGTVLGPLLLIIILQNYLNSVYEWVSDNNMFYNAQKFQYMF